MKRLGAILLLAGAVAAAAGGLYLLGYTESFTDSDGPLLRFRYPKTWEQTQTIPVSKNSGFLIVRDGSALGKRLRLSELHLSLVSKETWPDMKAAVAAIAGYRAPEAQLRRIQVGNWVEAVTFDMTFVDPLDKVVGGEVIIGTKVPMRFYLLRASDGRICEASYSVPYSFLARWRARSLYGRIIGSLELVEQR